MLPSGAAPDPKIIVDPNTGQHYVVFPDGQCMPIQAPAPAPPQLFPAANLNPNHPPSQPLPPLPPQPAVPSQPNNRPRPRPIPKNKPIRGLEEDSDEDELPTTISFKRPSESKRTDSEPAPAAKRAKVKAKERLAASSGSKSGAGRSQGATTYGSAELVKLAELVHTFRPRAKNIFHRDVVPKYNMWAKENGFQIREAEALRQRFDKVSSNPMFVLKHERPPTGNPEIPEAVRIAKEAEALIFQEAGVRHVDDDDNDDDDNEIQIIEPPTEAPTFKAPASKSNAAAKIKIKSEPGVKIKDEPVSPSTRPASATRGGARTTGGNRPRSSDPGPRSLAASLFSHFDPKTVAAREDQRAQTLYTNTQLNALNQQLAQKDNQLDRERMKIDELREQLNNQKLEIAKLQMEMRLSSAERPDHEHRRLSPSSGHRRVRRSPASPSRHERHPPSRKRRRQSLSSSRERRRRSLSSHHEYRRSRSRSRSCEHNQSPSLSREHRHGSPSLHQGHHPISPIYSHANPPSPEPFSWADNDYGVETIWSHPVASLPSPRTSSAHANHGRTSTPPNTYMRAQSPVLNSPINPFRRDTRGGPSRTASAQYQGAQGQGSSSAMQSDALHYGSVDLPLPPLDSYLNSSVTPSTAAAAGLANAVPTLPSLSEWAPPAAEAPPAPYGLPPLYHSWTVPEQATPHYPTDASTGGQHSSGWKGKGRAE
ncbi:hypothetical protein EVG20_g9313 [Dentipellis fragilis]|uniref:Uncharacterized protein n=1 Tax=Dentipellis fragilis TaxID=205917 RepID=A0A4Y9XZC8_9AGAM|nr:hypothetical protein EVG20_g9313 [Dentipellis fragilis]